MTASWPAKTDWATGDVLTAAQMNGIGEELNDLHTSGSSPLTTKGDLYGYSTTNARIPVGTNGQVLTADSTQSLGLKWASASSGGMTLLSTTTLSGATTTVSTINSSYKDLYVLVTGTTNDTANGSFRIALNGESNNSTQLGNFYAADAGGAYTLYNGYASRYAGNNSGLLRTNANNQCVMYIENYASTTSPKTFDFHWTGYDGNSSNYVQMGAGSYNSNSAISSIVFSNTGGNWSAGTVLIYGVS